MFRRLDTIARIQINTAEEVGRWTPERKGETRELQRNTFRYSHQPVILDSYSAKPEKNSVQNSLKCINDFFCVLILQLSCGVTYFNLEYDNVMKLQIITKIVFP